MQLIFKQHINIVRTLLFSIGIILSSNAFAIKPIGKTYATEEDLDTEISDRIDADTAEAQSRLARDVALAAEIEAEKRARQTADATETEDRTNADQTLRQQILDIPSAPNGLETGDMQYWDGTEWLLIPAAKGEGRAFISCDGVPQWSWQEGDQEPAGGIVIYVDDIGCHGREAATQDAGLAVWGCFNTYLGSGVSSAAGADLTTEILDRCDERPIAASLAAEYEQNGYTDYYLPSLTELLWINDQRDLIDGLGSIFYWSSTEGDASVAFPWEMGIERHNVCGYSCPSISKDLFSLVRAIRSF